MILHGAMAGLFLLDLALPRNIPLLPYYFLVVVLSALGYPIASLVKSGATVVSGSDWSVSSLNPLEAIQVAITRRGPTDSAGPPWIPEEVVDLTTMLKSYTITAAYAAHEEKTNGSLEVCKAAEIGRAHV